MIYNWGTSLGVITKYSTETTDSDTSRRASPSVLRRNLAPDPWKLGESLQKKIVYLSRWREGDVVGLSREAREWTMKKVKWVE